jgi:transcriptional regulator with XRE-family HTH domain
VPDRWGAVAAAIKERLDERRLTQHQLSSRSGVSPATIGELVTNRSPGRKRQPRTLQALSEALGWPAGHLDAVLRGTDPKNLERDDPVLSELVGIRDELRRITERLDHLERPATPGEGR